MKKICAENDVTLKIIKETQELNFGIYTFPVLLFHYDISPNTEYSVLKTVKLRL